MRGAGTAVQEASPVLAAEMQGGCGLPHYGQSRILGTRSVVQACLDSISVTTDKDGRKRSRVTLLWQRALRIGIAAYRHASSCREQLAREHLLPRASLAVLNHTPRA